MRSLIRRVVVVGVVGLIFVAALTAFRRRAANGAARYAAAKARATEACRAYRAAPGHASASVCRMHDEFGPSAFDVYRRADGELGDAKAALARGDAKAADDALTSAMAATDDLGRFGTATSAILAARLVDRGLALTDAHPELDRRRIVVAMRLDVARHPLEAERLHHQWHLARGVEQPEAAAIGEATLADAMETDDAAYREMERALLLGDDGQCRRSAEEVGRGIGGGGLATLLCDRLAAVVRTGQRLDAARAQIAAE
jgi:hypothetical protein